MVASFFLAVVFLFPALSSLAETQSLPAFFSTQDVKSAAESKQPLFPAAYFVSSLKQAPAPEITGENVSLDWVPTEEEMPPPPQEVRQEPPEEISMLLNNDILAFYGHPLSAQMGILGRYPVAELDERLTKLAGEYSTVNGDRGVRKAFYIIYGTVWPEGAIGIIKESVLIEYIQYALAHDTLVFIDHQIGRYDPVESLKQMFPYLKYPNVHLALDPEWRTAKPMQEIGRVTADEINRAQEAMETYLVENKLPGERMLVIHQFKPWMIENRANVKSDFRHVRLVHCADGFGNPAQKRGAYASNAEAKNIPVKAFKLFYNFNIPGAGYDAPLLSPKEVMELNPRPYLIMYQ